MLTSDSNYKLCKSNRPEFDRDSHTQFVSIITGVHPPIPRQLVPCDLLLNVSLWSDCVDHFIRCFAGPLSTLAPTQDKEPVL